MKISVKNQGKCEKVLSLQIPSERVRKEFDKFYSEATKVAKVPGFRPGHVPADVVKMHYAKEAREEVLKNLIQETTFEALKQEKIEPLYYPSVNKVNFEGDELSFDLLVELRPEVKLGTYKGVKVKKNPIVVEDKDINEAILRIQESYSKFIPVADRSVEMGDFLVCDLDCDIDGKKVESRKDDWFEVDPKKAQEELAKGLVGMKTGEKREVEVGLPKDFPAKEYAGKKAKFTVTVKEIKTRELPAVTDEWAQGLGEFKTVEEFKKKISEDLHHRKEQEEGHRFENEILESLLKDSKIELSAGSVERRTDWLLENEKKHYESRKMVMTPEDLEKRRGELKPEAEKQLKLAFILQEISKKENLKASPEDLEAKYKDMADRSKVSLEKVKKYYEDSEERLDNLTHQIGQEKVLNFLKQNASA